MDFKKGWPGSVCGFAQDKEIFKIISCIKSINICGIIIIEKSAKFVFLLLRKAGEL